MMTVPLAARSESGLIVRRDATVEMVRVAAHLADPKESGQIVRRAVNLAMARVARVAISGIVLRAPQQAAAMPK